MRPAPETGNELPPFLSGGLTYPEEEKILCKKREQGTRITCSPDSNTKLCTEMKGNKRFIFRLCAAAALFLNLFPLQAGECTLMSYNVKNGKEYFLLDGSYINKTGAEEIYRLLSKTR